MRMPLLLRRLEKYVCVLEEGWRVRYKSRVESSERRYVCQMSWLWKYYVGERVLEMEVYEECSPLLCELSECVRVNKEKCKEKESESESESGEVLDAYAQLLYVLPEESWCKCGLEKELKEISSSDEASEVEVVSKKESGLLCKYEWAYNEYFWECVPRLKKISVETLEKWNKASKIYRNNNRGFV
jgi:hypothetical protein